MGGQVGGTDADDHHFFGDTFLAQAQSLFERDIVERVGRKLHAVRHNARTIGLDLDSHVVIHDALVTNKNLHLRVLHGWPPSQAEAPILAGFKHLYEIGAGATFSRWAWRRGSSLREAPPGGARRQPLRHP